MTRRCAESVELSCSWAKNAPSQGMIDRGRRGAGELDPASRVAVPTGRDFTDKQLHARLYGLYALYGLVRAHPLADPMSPEGGAAQRGHGAVRGAEPGSALTHRQVAKVLADVAAKVTRTVVKAGSPAPAAANSPAAAG